MTNYYPFFPLIVIFLYSFSIFFIQNSFLRYLIIFASVLLGILSTIDITIGSIVGFGLNSAFLYHLFFMDEVEGLSIIRNGMFTFVSISIVFFALFVIAVLTGRQFAWVRNKVKFVGVVPGLLFGFAAYISAPLHETLNYFSLNPLAITHQDLTPQKHPQKIEKNKINPSETNSSHDGPDLVFIFVEAFERTYLDMDKLDPYLGELKRIEDNSLSFTNITQLKDSSWTIAGMVSSLCGIPLTHPSGGNTLGRVERFYPGAVCLTDILQNAGYNSTFIQGSNLDFAGVRQFYEQHGVSELRGKRYFKEKYPVISTHHWGYDDETVLAEAFQTLKEGNTAEKKAVIVSTIDTHFPNGHVKKTCQENKTLPTQIDETQPNIIDAVVCTGSYLASFINRVRNDQGTKDSIIVVVSDHIAQSPPLELFKGAERKNLFFVNLPRNTLIKKIKVVGAQLDIGTTVARLMGFDTTLGLGVDLLASTPSVAAMQNVEEYLQSQKSDIMRLWDFPEAIDDFWFQEDHLVVDGKRYNFPVLFQLEQNDALLPFYKDGPGSLFGRMSKFSSSSSFLLVDECAQIEFFFDGSRRGGKYCYALGKMGAQTQVRKISSGDRISAQVIDEVRETLSNNGDYAQQVKKLAASHYLTSRQRWLLNQVPKGSTVFLEKEFYTLGTLAKMEREIESFYPVNVVMQHPVNIDFFKIENKLYSGFDKNIYHLEELGKIQKQRYIDSIAGLFYQLINPIVRLFDSYGVKRAFDVAVRARVNGQLSSPKSLVYRERFNEKERYIAHAGSMIDGRWYTNSLEALEQAYLAGIRLIELDFIETSDGHLVAAHDWRMWKKISGFSGSIPPTMKEFKSRKIFEKYTALSLSDVEDWFRRHPDAILVTDKVNDPRAVADKFRMKDRLIMELFSWDAIESARLLGIKSAMPSWQLIESSNMDVEELREMGIKHVAITKGKIIPNFDFIKDAKAAGIKFYAFNVNITKHENPELHFACSYLDIVYGMYLDRLSVINSKCR